MARTSRSRGKTPFNMKSGNKTSFKNMGSSPMKTSMYIPPGGSAVDPMTGETITRPLTPPRTMGQEPAMNQPLSRKPYDQSSHYAKLHEKRSARGFDEARANQPSLWETDPNAYAEQQVKKVHEKYNELQKQVEEGTITPEESKEQWAALGFGRSPRKKTAKDVEQFKRDYYGPGYQGDNEDFWDQYDANSESA